ncbi:MAG: type II toxin-antitoxin system VapC family toxin [Alphaproteobacteria bacterium]
MRIAVDTNVLLRAVVEDDPGQQIAAVEVLEGAELAAVSLQSLCEFVWVLERRYGVARADIAASIRAVLGIRNISVNRPAVEAGMSVFEAGGDFADGVIAYDGRWLGGETFVSFDKKAVRLLTARGQAARLLG